MGLFLYWIWIYQDQILTVFRHINIEMIATIILLLLISGALTVYVFITIIRAKGYTLSFWDGYHTLNLSQMASMIPGGIWGYAGLAGALWNKGISKTDSLLIIFLHTLTMLTACAMVGVSGLVSVFGVEYALISILPFVLLLFGRNQMDKIRQKYLPNSSQLPSTKVLLKALALGVTVWIIASSCFALFFYSSTRFDQIPFWIIEGAYAAAYLGGYITLFAPSGLGVSEGLVVLMLGPSIGTGKALATAISFRIINTAVIWFNILVTLVVTWKAKNQ